MSIVATIAVEMAMNDGIFLDESLIVAVIPMIVAIAPDRIAKRVAARCDTKRPEKSAAAFR